MQALLEQKDVNSKELQSLLEARELGKINFMLVDVREDMEFEMSHIRGADLLKPTSVFEEWASDFFHEVEDETVIFTCRTGNRSGQVRSIFAKNGHKNVINHYGGIVSYRGEINR
ncbi:MAG: rhodanese-like domain-containing protein [Campylobacterota bacterium]|nr:rhodanese-like domain-containing protein [Campylobacterota bacterium]